MSVMARKKVVPAPAPETSGGFVSIINLKGSAAYRGWLSGLSKKTHIPAAAIVRLALAEWASRNGHPSPPEK
jgi:hypothetical protein